MNNLKKQYFSTYFLCVFKELKKDSVFNKFINFLETFAIEENLQKDVENFVEFVSCLKQKDCIDFSEYLKRIIFSSKYKNDDKNQIEKELKILSELSKLNYQRIKEIFVQKYPDYVELFENLPNFLSCEISLDYESLKNLNISIEDKYKNNRAFVFGDDFNIEPVELCEKITFASLKGYQEQKRVLFENTKALLSGARVNNILLYGDAGCGKSSSVRALLNEFEELKIVQIFKKNLVNLDKLYLKLKDLPYKFIIFADDISFDETDGVFSTMKAVLEGSLIQCPKNAVIYATSNRRHLVKESFKARSGDEIHLNDTINEINSLSERFGINLFFSKPTNEEFKNIVLELAKDYNIEIDEKTLISKAQRLALIKGTNSPRIAKQLIDNLLANINI